jgi:hypothetical protein
LARWQSAAAAVPGFCPDAPQAVGTRLCAGSRSRNAVRRYGEDSLVRLHPPSADPKQRIEVLIPGRKAPTSRAMTADQTLISSLALSAARCGRRAPRQPGECALDRKNRACINPVLKAEVGAVVGEMPGFQCRTSKWRPAGSASRAMAPYGFSCWRRCIGGKLCPLGLASSMSPPALSLDAVWHPRSEVLSSSR